MDPTWTITIPYFKIITIIVQIFTGLSIVVAAVMYRHTIDIYKTNEGNRRIRFDIEHFSYGITWTAMGFGIPFILCLLAINNWQFPGLDAHNIWYWYGKFIQGAAIWSCVFFGAAIMLLLSKHINTLARKRKRHASI